MDSTKQTNFTAPEFYKVFQRIKDRENKQGFYCVRQLNKFHQAQFEQRINCGKLNFQNLQSLSTSKFADQIQYLNVRIPGDLNDLSNLLRASPTFLPNIQKINVIFTEGQSQQKIISISEPLVFRGLNVVHENQREHIEILCQNNDVQIMDTNFDGIGLFLFMAKKVTVKNSSFGNVTRPYPGVSFSRTQNTITIDNVQFFNCEMGLGIIECGNDNVYINKIYAEKCQIGCRFMFINGELKLNDAEIVDCETGMRFDSVNNSKVQNCNSTSALKTGVMLHGSTVQYRRIFIHQSDGSEEEFKKVDSVNSTFTETL